MLVDVTAFSINERTPYVDHCGLLYGCLSPNLYPNGLVVISSPSPSLSYSSISIPPLSFCHTGPTLYPLGLLHDVETKPYPSSLLTCGPPREPQGQNMFNIVYLVPASSPVTFP